MESKLKDLKEGEIIGIEFLPIVLGMKKMSMERKQELFLNELRDGIGRCFVVQKGSFKTVAVLLDIDFDTDPSNKRYIFAYYNSEIQEDVTIDTLYDEGWHLFQNDATKE